MLEENLNGAPSPEALNPEEGVVQNNFTAESLEVSVNAETNPENENRIGNPEAPAAETSAPEREAEASTPEKKKRKAKKPEAETAEETAAETESDHVDPELENKKNAETILQEILASGDQFEDVIETAQATEMVFLMEHFAHGEGETIRRLIPKFPLLRKAFEKTIKEQQNADPVPDGLDKLEKRFQIAAAKFNHKRGDAEVEMEKERGENSRLKSELLDRLKEIAEKEQVEAIGEVRSIQNRWKEIGWVKTEDREPFFERYRHYLDVFYGLRERYNDLLEIDRKHNLEEKQKLIAEVTALIPSENALNHESWKAVSEMVKELQEIWRSVGPVPRNDIDATNESWKTTLDGFYSKRTEYYELQDGERKENSEKKIALLERMKEYQNFQADRVKDWADVTEVIINLQKEWQSIGPGTSEVNKNLWKEYRDIFDGFFKNKNTFFEKLKDERNRNLNMKNALIEKAETLKESTNWRETSKALKQLQEEWKQIGPVNEKLSNKIWKKFRDACDGFFQARDNYMKEAGLDQDQNLKAKQELIARMNALESSELSERELLDEYDKIQDEWRTIGHVPFQDKDTIFKGFRDASDAIGRKHNLYNQNFRQNNFQPPHREENHSTGNKVEDKIRMEITKLKEKMEIVQKKINTYENNILMVAKGKSGDSLRQQIQAQIDSEKARVVELKQKSKEMRAEAEKQKSEKAAEAVASAAETVAAQAGDSPEA